MPVRLNEPQLSAGVDVHTKEVFCNLYSNVPISSGFCTRLKGARRLDLTHLTAGALGWTLGNIPVQTAGWAAYSGLR
jgi:hypothetical protein